MSLLNPAGLGFAAIIPLIILLYLLKRRFQEKVISSTYLWEEVLKDMEATTPWQRLKKNLLLFLQLLAAVLLVMALSRPYLPVAGGLEKQLLVVLDASASMMASDVTPSRWGMAQKEVEKLIDRLGPGEKMTLIKMGEQPEVLQAASGDKNELRRALRDAQLETGRADLEAALSLIASLSRDSRDIMLLIVSDGKTLPMEHDPGIKCPVEFIQIGRGSDNLAITTLATRRDSGQVLALARVQNFGEKAVVSDIELRVDGELFDIREIKLEAEGAREIIWEDLPAGAESIQAILQRPDFLPADNEAWAVVEELTENRALLVSQGNLFLEKALNLLPGLELFKTSPAEYDPALADYQLFIFDGWLPAHLPQASIIIVNPPPGNPWLAINGEAKNLSGIKAAGEDSNLRYIDSSDWQVARSQKLLCPDWARTLLESEGVPLLLAGQLSGRVAIFSFDLHESNIPLQTGFPILVHNLVGWLLPGNAGASFDLNRSRISFDPHPEAEAIYLQRPGEKEERYLPPFPRSFSASHPGLYQINQVLGDRIESNFLARNQGDPLESDIKPATLPWQAFEAESRGGGERLGKKELWPWLCWAVLLLLLLEWEVYRRGY